MSSGLEDVKFCWEEDVHMVSESAGRGRQDRVYVGIFWAREIYNLWFMGYARSGRQKIIHFPDGTRILLPPYGTMDVLASSFNQYLRARINIMEEKLTNVHKSVRTKQDKFVIHGGNHRFRNNGASAWSLASSSFSIHVFQTNRWLASMENHDDPSSRYWWCRRRQDRSEDKHIKLTCRLILHR